MTTYMTAENQQGLVSALSTKRDLRNLLRKVRDSDDRVKARIADKAIIRALKHFRVSDLAQAYGVGTMCVSHYIQRVLLKEPMPGVKPPPIDWKAVDREIRMGWELRAIAKSIGPAYIAAKFGITEWQARRAGETVGGSVVLGSADPELLEAVIEARNEYRATKAKALTFTKTAIGERHGTSESTICLRARALRELDKWKCAA